MAVLPPIMTQQQKLRLEYMLKKGFFLHIIDERSLKDIAIQVSEQGRYIDYDLFSNALESLRQATSISIIDLGVLFQNMLNVLSSEGFRALAFARKNASDEYKKAVNYYAPNDPMSILFDRDIETLTQREFEYCFKERTSLYQETFDSIQVLFEPFGPYGDFACYIPQENTFIFYPLSAYFKSYLFNNLIINQSDADFSVQEIGQQQPQTQDKNKTFINFLLKVASHNLAHEMVHIIEPCFLEENMLRHIVESKKGYFYAEQYMENLDPNTFSHCATFKMTLLYMCRLESSPIYIRPAFFEALLKYIKDETTYEFFLNRQGLSTRLTSESNMSYADPKIGGHIKDINLYNYRWESGKLYALLNIEGSSTPLLFTPSSGVTKTTDIVEEFYIELSKKHSYRKNYAEVPRSPEAKTPTFLSTDRDSIYPVIAYKGECNLLKINSKLNAHAFLLHVFTKGTLMDSALLKNKSGEAGLFMYINNDEVEFIYIDINGTPCLVSLAEAWWILSL